MTNLFGVDSLHIRRQSPLRSRFIESLQSDDLIANDVAWPLFKAGIRKLFLYERSNYATRDVVRPYHDLTLLLEGRMKVRQNGHEYTVGPGELMVCPAGIGMKRAVGKGPAWFLIIEISDMPRWNPIKERGFYIRPYESSLHVFILLRNILDAKASHRRSEVARSIDDSTSILKLLDHEISFGRNVCSEQAKALHDVVNRITEAPALDWSRESIAAKLHLSVRQTSRLFHQEFGISPRQLLIRKRMQIATIELANSNRTIQAIASDLGYESVHSFTRLFTKHVGMSPGQYRSRRDA